VARVSITLAAVDAPERSRTAVVAIRWLVTATRAAVARVGDGRGTAVAAIAAIPVWRKAVNGVVRAPIAWTRTPLTSVEMASPFPR
jgi:FAD/FMN-containing dehydrogenase